MYCDMCKAYRRDLCICKPSIKKIKIYNVRGLK